MHLIHQFRLIIRDWQIHEFEHFMSLNISFMSNYTEMLYTSYNIIQSTNADFLRARICNINNFLIIKNIIAARRAVLFSKMERLFRLFPALRSLSEIMNIFISAIILCHAGLSEVPLITCFTIFPQFRSLPDFCRKKIALR